VHTGNPVGDGGPTGDKAYLRAVSVTDGEIPALGYKIAEKRADIAKCLFLVFYGEMF
jgi:hypothetical protein